MTWITVIAIMAAATLVNHLGLIAAIEQAAGRMLKREVRLPVLNCSKCLSFWATLLYVAIELQRNERSLWVMVILPPLMAYAAWWMELLLGYLDTQYDKAYDALYTKAGMGGEPVLAEREEDTSADGAQRTDDAVPEVREEVKSEE